MTKLTVAFRSFPNAPKKTGLNCIQDESVGINTVASSQCNGQVKRQGYTVYRMSRLVSAEFNEYNNR
jgi:hypothetical protein